MSQRRLWQSVGRGEVRSRIALAKLMRLHFYDRWVAFAATAR